MWTARVERTTDFTQEIFVFEFYTKTRVGKWCMKLGLALYIKNERVNIKGDWVKTKETYGKPRNYEIAEDVIDEAKDKFCQKIRDYKI